RSLSPPTSMPGGPEIGRARWAPWRRKQQLEERIPAQLAEVVSAVVVFADPAVSGEHSVTGLSWDPSVGSWS
ncbi:MAG: hypothetical protein ACYCO3_13915, partial [Mycobacteriales bacterium]